MDQILPFEEVVRALGRRGERQLGLQTIPLESIVGTVDRSREFDREFRPTSGRPRDRWQRIAAAMRRGQAMPPIEVYRVGDLHFVKDGHHRVSVAKALGRHSIDAYVTEVLTEEPAPAGSRLPDLLLKDHRRVFRDRVPLPPDAMARIQLSDSWDYSVLAEGAAPTVSLTTRDGAGLPIAPLCTAVTDPGLPAKNVAKLQFASRKVLSDTMAVCAVAPIDATSATLAIATVTIRIRRLEPS